MPRSTGSPTAWIPTLLAALALLLLSRIPVLAEPPAPPRITAIQVDARGARVSVAVPAGLRRIVLETTRRTELTGWTPRAVYRLDGSAQTVVLELPADAPSELLRVRADEHDPLPAAFYAGRTNIAPDPLPGGGPAVFRGGEVVTLNDGSSPQTPVTSNSGGTAAVVESDIWQVRGTRLYFFNQLRGLQVIDVARPDAPRLAGTLAFPAAGEQLYVPDDRHVVLLLREDCRGNGYSGAAIAVADVSADQPREVARLAIPGRLFESRMIGSALHVASQTWENTDAATGVWEMATVVSSFDLSNPAAPVARGSRRIPGSASVVTAADHYFFVGQDVTGNGAVRTTELHVLDVGPSDGTVSEFATLRFTGWLRDKFKLHLRGDVLRLVVEDQETPAKWSPITRLTTWRLAADGAANYRALGRLDLGAGENLYGTRFDGDRAYVVTFRRIDPLWIVDLSDPEHPRVQGELKIPGWSNYLHPLGDRLLAVGIDDTAGWRAAVQLFDVADPARPALLAKIPLGENWSWSEAYSDEKAFGVFPESGLVLIPFSSAGQQGSVQGVQVIDFGRDTLKARGVIEHDTFTPRRSTPFGSRVLSLSARELLTADLTDRDQPKITGRLELARRTDRIVADRDHLLSFSDTEIRVARADSPETTMGTFDLGKLPVLGTARRGDLLYILQGVAAQISWESDADGANWTTTTNAGVVQLRILSVAALPKLAEVGEITEKHLLTTLSEATPLWPVTGTLVWASRAQTGYYGPWVDFLRPVATFAADGVTARGIWWPGRWWGQPRTLVAFGVNDPARPVLHSTFVSEAGAASTGTAFAGDGLVLFSESFQESTVIGTNEVTWIELSAPAITNTVIDKEITLLPESHVVTNLVPILQWWQRHQLRVVDYAAGGGAPVVRSPLAFPGELRGVARGGNVLFSVGQKAEGTTNAVTRDVLELSAYDGVSVFVGDSVPLSVNGEETSRAHVTPEGQVAVTLANWNNPDRNRLRVLALDNARFTQVAEVRLGGQPQDSVLVDRALLIQGAGALEIWDLANAAAPKSVPALDHGCVWFDLQGTTGSSEAGWWAPGGDYGALRLDAR